MCDDLGLFDARDHPQISLVSAQMSISIGNPPLYRARCIRRGMASTARSVTALTVSASGARSPVAGG